MDLGPVLGGKVHVGEHVDLAVVDEGCELGPLGAERSAVWRMVWLALARSGWINAWRRAADTMLCWPRPT